MFFTENNAILDVKLDNKQYGVFFVPHNNNVFAAKEYYEAAAIFDSPLLDGGNGFVSWKEINIDCDKPENTNIYFYIRSSENNTNINEEAWVGPILKYNQYSISNISNKFLQIRLLMTTNIFTNENPKLNSIHISCFKVGKEEVFFTKAFNLSFKPKHILLTYNGQISKDTLIRFAISGEDTSDKNKFHIINPNSIENIENLPFSDKIKLMISGIGERTIPFVIDEFSFILSGDSQIHIE